MHTAPSGNVPRGQGALPLGASAGAPLARGRAGTLTCRGERSVSAETAMSSAAIAPARTSDDTPPRLRGSAPP